MNKYVNFCWPMLGRISAADKQKYDLEDLDLDRKINSFKAVNDKEVIGVYLEAVLRIQADEEGRKASAESRATTFIAALAAIIPLMTWALGNSARPAISTGWFSLAWSILWTLIFILSVAYFIASTYWSLRSINVANYHVIGIETLLEFNKGCTDVSREMIKRILLYSRKNRDTINEKITFIKIAQAHFVRGVFVLAGLLILSSLLKMAAIWPLMEQGEGHASPTSEKSKSSASESPAQPNPRADDIPRIFYI